MEVAAVPEYVEQSVGLRDTLLQRLGEQRLLHKDNTNCLIRNHSGAFFGEHPVGDEVVGVPLRLVIVPQAVVQERHHIDRVELPVQFPLRQFQMVQPRRIIDTPLEEAVLFRGLHLHDERSVVLVHTYQVQHRLLPVDHILLLLAVGILLDVLDPRLGREDLVQHPDEDVLVVPVREHGLEADIAPQIHERSELLSLFFEIHGSILN